jgi:hypothetical protein
MTQGDAIPINTQDEIPKRKPEVDRIDLNF